ncbi:unnamed protein product [marine sediment metagenome]|uniref:FAD/NAD(P)-binding domain-containing protein n=1 Tax=marine sediment metagenome TaxID=412755 RepID=X1IJM4_9ZZZZ
MEHLFLEKEIMVNNNLFDVVIVGGGPAGLTAGIYTSRARLKTLLIESINIPSQSAMTDLIENYPGFPEGVSGFELLTKFKNQAKQFGTEFLSDTVNNIKLKNSNGNKKEWYVETENNKIECLSVIIAVGARYKKLNVPGEIKFQGNFVAGLIYAIKIPINAEGFTSHHFSINPI